MSSGPSGEPPPRERRRPRSPRSPRAAVRRELVRAVLGLGALPVRVLDFLVCNQALRDELRGYLGSETPVDESPPAPVRRDRPLELFVSCAEASGELHAANLVRALRAELAAAGAPPPRLAGLGGPRLADLGVELVAEPVRRAAMGFDGMLSSVPYYLGVLRAAAEVFERRPPEVVVPVDSPALHVPLARIAKGYGLPVVHHVSPQLWGWAPWRAGAYRRAVDRTLTILPFEPAWFARRDVPATHVGHPLLDELAVVPVPDRRGAVTARPPVLALLPGSREAVIERNLPWMLRRLERLRARAPELRAVVVQSERHFEERLRAHVEAAGAAAWVRVECGDLHASLAGATAAFTVSGTVLLDLVHQRLPTVVVYRVARGRDVWMYRHLLSTPWFASANLVLGRAALPEFCFTGEGPREEIEAALERALLDRAWIRATRDALERCAELLGPPGASRRAARRVLWTASGREPDAPEPAP